MNKTTQSRLLLSCLFVALISATYSALATPVGPMNYQGRLLDNSGVPVTGTYDFVVKIYDDPSTGSLQYQETFNNISVNDGVYSIKIGTQTPDTGTWDVALWQNNLNDLFLELEAGTLPSSMETLSPRYELTSSPHAFTSTLALSAESLGAKTAAEYDNILQGVCVASKGKWLELVEQCLGRGASFPGPSLVNWNTLTNSSNFRGLDLTDADISGIDFGGANLRDSTFTNTTYSVEGMDGANLWATKWDGANATDVSAYTPSSSTYLNAASFKNMDMSKWNMSLITYLQYYDISAGYLSACPVAMPSDIECRLMKSSGSDYFFAGHRVNLSSTGAAATVILGKSVLDIDRDALNNLELDLASLVGISLSADFENTDFYQADLSNITLTNSTFDLDCRLAGTKLIGATLNNVTFDDGVFWSSPDFSNASLQRVSTAGTLAGGIFNGATLRQVDFERVGASKFIGAIFEDVRISDYIYSNNVPYETSWADVRVYGELHINNYTNGNGTFVMSDMAFNGATVSGDLTQSGANDANFTGNLTLNRVTFTDIDMTGVTIPVTGGAPHPELSTVFWGPNTICPDGTAVSGGGPGDAGGCDYSTRMTP